MVPDQRAAARRVDTGEIGDVEAIGLEPPQHRIFGREEPVGGTEAAGLSARAERTVVAHLERALRAAQVQAEAAVLVVRLPRRVGRLEQHVRRARVVADDEHDVAGAAGVGADRFRDVNPRHRGGGNGPRRRLAPVPAVDEKRRVVGETGRLALARHARDRRHFARAEACVVAESIHVDAERGRRRVDLEMDGSAAVHADVGRESLNARVAGAGDVPLGRWIAGQIVLAHDGIRSARLRVRIGPRADRDPGGNQKEEDESFQHDFFRRTWFERNTNPTPRAKRLPGSEMRSKRSFIGVRVDSARKNAIRDVVGTIRNSRAGRNDARPKTHSVPTFVAGSQN